MIGVTLGWRRATGSAVGFVPVHRMQAYQKYGIVIFKKGMAARHLDGNPLNNRWENIVLGTYSDNMMDIPKKVRLRTAKYAASFLHRFSKSQIAEIRRLRAEDGLTYKAIALRMGIKSKGHIFQIVHRQVYK